MANGLIPAYESETGQVVLEGRRTGAAGGAGLVPAPGLELVFDNADGRLARVVVDAAGPGGEVRLADPVAGALKSMLGWRAPATVVKAAARPGGIKRMLAPNPSLAAVWSRLARLDFTQATSPVPPASPLWAAEAAQLARKGGLHTRARSEARRAAAGLAEILKLAPISASLAEIALVVADLAEPDQPEAARRLRDRAVPRTAGPGGAGARPSWAGDAARADLPADGGYADGELCLGKDPLPDVEWALDPGVVPSGLFQAGLAPLSDLSVYRPDGRDQIVVEALLAPGPDRGALGRCRARLVDPLARRVLAAAPFTAHGPRARAQLAFPFPLAELSGAWVEVVDDEHRMVHSERLHRIRRALRWADAALRAERRPAGLMSLTAGQDWMSLAAAAWERCRLDWQAAGDPDRAYLADRRSAAVAPENGIPGGAPPPLPPSGWAARLAEWPPLSEPAFLAETAAH